jgi:[ribosomal protein S5]-alanine N-acetyltransferase
LELRGPTLTLRLPVAEDADRLFELGRDERVTGWFSWGPYTDPAQPRAWIAGAPARREAGEALELVVVHPRDGVIGVIALLELARRDRRAMTGTWIGHAWWGTGANAEAKALLAHLAFRTCRLERLGAYCNVDNHRSLAALQDLGFRHEGVLRRFHRHGDRQLDVHVLGLLREEFEAGPLGAVRATAVRSPPAAWVMP